MLLFVFVVNLVGVALLTLSGVAVAVDELRIRRYRHLNHEAYRQMYEAERRSNERKDDEIRRLEKILRAGVFKRATNEHGEIAP